MDSKVGLLIQFSGIFLITLLSAFLTSSLKSTALKYWKYAWLSLSFALLCLYAAFTFEAAAKPFFALYYLGEYMFALLLIAGCRNFASDREILANNYFLLIPAVVAAVVLAFPVGEFNEVFNFHSFILGTCFLIAFFALKPSDKMPLHRFGWRVMRFALLLLAFDFFHYTIIFSLQNTSYPQQLGSYLAYNSVIDLVLEILLGFGMVIVSLEKVRQDVEEINLQLKAAHDKLEKLANVDPLTTAFTRHAFYSFLQKYNKENDIISGCVGVFDIDNLKPVNDRFGHHIGDIVISSTARAIRSLVRADDLIFRWGGDEFFVVMLGFNTDQAVERMCGLQELLKNMKLRGLTERISIGVSFGFANFNDIKDLENAVENADAEMYQAKQQNKCADKTIENDYLPPPISVETPAGIQ